MKQRNPFSLPTTWLVLVLLFSSSSVAHAQSADPLVRAILFYSPTCPHCAMVIQQDLPPLLEKYGQQLEIAGIDVSNIEGVTLYQTAIARFQIPEGRLGVPTLIIGDTVLVGSIEIPGQLPGLIEQHLSQGGVDWPDLPGLVEALTVSTPAQTVEHPAEPTATIPSPLTLTPEPATTTETIPATFPTLIPTQAAGLLLPEEHELSWQEKFTRDLAGNLLSVFVLLGMLGSLLWVFVYFARRERLPTKINTSWSIPVLCLLGVGVAGYLSYVETTQVTAVCGPVGDCNTVQQSEYARLFGILPIGILGLAGYTLIILAWLVARFSQDGAEHLATLALLGMTFAGTLFSVYLTFLEPFVIGATCIWCLTSAVVMTALMLASLAPGKSAYLVLIKPRDRKV